MGDTFTALTQHFVLLSPLFHGANKDKLRPQLRDATCHRAVVHTEHVFTKLSGITTYCSFIMLYPIMLNHALSCFIEFNGPNGAIFSNQTWLKSRKMLQVCL